MLQKKLQKKKSALATAWFNDPLINNWTLSEKAS